MKGKDMAFHGDVPSPLPPPPSPDFPDLRTLLGSQPLRKENKLQWKQPSVPRTRLRPHIQPVYFTPSEEEPPRE